MAACIRSTNPTFSQIILQLLHHKVNPDLQNNITHSARVLGFSASWNNTTQAWPIKGTHKEFVNLALVFIYPCL